MKLQFNYYMPTRVIFGAGKLKELATSPYLPGKKALIVMSAGGSLKKYGYLDQVLTYLKDNGVAAIIYNKIQQNPIDEHVAEGAAIAKENNCDFIIGFGGGSPIDSSKSIAIMAKNPGEYWDYIHGGTGKGQDPTQGALPVVAINTTAGTGTEADPWTVITKSSTNEKIGFGTNDTFPVLSFVDPELMVNIPPDYTAYQGMDAFFHSVEGYLATVNQPASDSFALNTISLINKYLPMAVQNGNNLEARSAVAWASTQSGMVESLSSCISHHSMEHALSAHHPNLPHGAGLILLSTSYFHFFADKVPDRFIDMAKAMGENVDSLPDKEKPFAFITALKRLINNINMANLKLADFGINKDESDKLAKNALDTMGFLFTLDPYKLSHEDIVSIYEKSF